MFVVNAVSGAVGNTVGAVAGAIRLGNRNGSPTMVGDGETLDHWLRRNSLREATLNVKSSSPKSFYATTQIAARSGALIKRNEQGKWHPVQATVVPHWFLYYYDEGSLDEPKGIIDLHCYTPSITQETVKLDRTEELPVLNLEPEYDSNEAHNPLLKSFFFCQGQGQTGQGQGQGADKRESKELRDWIATIRDERYEAILASRNAYQEAQAGFAPVLEDMNNKMSEDDVARKDITMQAAKLQLELDGCRAAMQAVLLSLGVSRDDKLGGGDASSSPPPKDPKAGVGPRDGLSTAPSASGQISATAFAEKVNKVIREMRASHDTELARASNDYKRLSDQARAEQSSLESQLQRERSDHAAMQHDMHSQASAKEDSLRKELSLSRAAVEQLRSELAVAASRAAEAEAATAAVGAEKKVLVREVKAQRKASADLKADKDGLIAEKESITAALHALVEQKEALLRRIAAYDERGSLSLGGTTMGIGVGSAHAHRAAAPASSASSSFAGVGAGAGAAFEGDVTRSQSESGLESGSAASVHDGERQSSYPAPSYASSLADLSDTEGDGSDAFAAAGSHHPPGGNLLAAGAPALPAPAPARRSTLQVFQDILRYDPHQDNSHTQNQSPVALFKDRDESAVSHVPFSTSSDSPRGAALASSASSPSPIDNLDGAGGASSPLRCLRCLRCSGTVEGPKHSTCACKVPLLQTDEEAEASASASASAAAAAAAAAQAQTEQKMGNHLFSQMSSGMSSVFNVARRASANLTTPWGGASGAAPAGAEDR